MSFIWFEIFKGIAGDKPGKPRESGSQHPFDKSYHNLLLH
jgi:hypothetical protein